MTNREWLNSLSNEELGKMVEEACKMCIGDDDDKICFKHTCAEGITEWLNKKRNPNGRNAEG